MWVCTATTRHGDWHEVVASEPMGTPTLAFDVAATLVNIGYRCNTVNFRSARVLLGRWENGERPAPGERYMEEGYVHLKDEPEGPVVSIGWTDYVLREVPQVPRLWAVQAQVRVNLERQGWSMARQVPTFYLDPTVQGITGPDTARAVAEDILHTLSGDAENVELTVSVEPIY